MCSQKCMRPGRSGGSLKEPASVQQQHLEPKHPTSCGTAVGRCKSEQQVVIACGRNHGSESQSQHKADSDRKHSLDSRAPNIELSSCATERVQVQRGAMYSKHLISLIILSRLGLLCANSVRSGALAARMVFPRMNGRLI